MIPFLGSLKIYAIIGVAVIVMIGGFYWYYTDSQSRIQTLSENNAKLETAVSINEETISSMKADQEKIASELRRVNEEFQNIRIQNNELRDRLGKHDIGALGNAKPKLVERVINNASEKAGRCLEILSGAPLTDKERNAKNARSFNSECPFLWTGDSRP